MCVTIVATIYLFFWVNFKYFFVCGDHHFQNFFNFNPFIASHGRLSPNAKRSAAPRVRGRSGDTHLPQAQNGSSLYPERIFSNRLKLVPEPHLFTLDREPVPEPLPIFHFAAAHTYQNLGSVPPPPGGLECAHAGLRNGLEWNCLRSWHVGRVWLHSLAGCQRSAGRSKPAVGGARGGGGGGSKWSGCAAGGWITLS